jgi:hypothetical protein
MRHKKPSVLSESRSQGLKKGFFLFLIGCAFLGFISSVHLFDSIEAKEESSAGVYHMEFAKQNSSTALAIPRIDQSEPAQIATATFALG